MRWRRGRRVGTAALAGVLATLPMTAVMEAGFRLLPRREQYALPPRQITEALDEEFGSPLPEREGARVLTTLLLHLAYGGAAAVPLGAARSRSAGSAAAQGGAYGLGIWLLGYLGWLPALGLLTPATHHPAGRNAVMIAAHLVWGIALGMLARSLRR